MDFYEQWEKIFKDIHAKYSETLDDSSLTLILGEAPTLSFFENLNSTLFKLSYLDGAKKKLSRRDEALLQLTKLVNLKLIKKDETISQKIRDLIAKITEEKKALVSVSVPRATSDRSTQLQVIGQQSPIVDFNIPADVFVLIFQYLSLEEVVRLAVISKRFQQLTKTLGIWQHFSGIFFPPNPEAQLTPYDGTKLAFSTRYPKHYANVSRNTRIIFELVFKRDLAGLKANARWITFDSLAEHDGNGQNYLFIARQREYFEIEEFILLSLKHQNDSSDYLDLKYTVVSARRMISALDPTSLIHLFKRILLCEINESQVFSPGLINLTIKNRDYNCTLWILKNMYTDELFFGALITTLKDQKDLFGKLVKALSSKIERMLILAIRKGRFDLVKVLVQLSPACFDENRNRNTILDIAVTEIDVQIVRFLVNRTIVFLKSTVPSNLLYLVIFANKYNPDVVDYLVLHRQILQLDLSNSNLLLLKAIEMIDARYLQSLTKAGLQFRQKEGLHVQIAQAILENHRQLEDHKNIFAVLKKDHQISVHSLILPNGETMLHRAVVSGSNLLVRALCSFECTEDVINARDTNGNTPFHALVSTTGDCTREPANAKALLGANANLTLRNNDGDTAIDALVKTNDLDRILEIFMVLHKLKVFHPQNEESQRLLKRLIDNPYTSDNHLIRCLELGVDVNQVDNGSLLYNALARPRVVRLLMLYGANPSLTVNGESSYEYCKKNSNHALARRALAIFECREHFKDCIALLKNPPVYSFLPGLDFSASLKKAAECDMEFTRMQFEKIAGLDISNDDFKELSFDQIWKLRLCAKQDIFSEKSDIPGEPNTRVQSLMRWEPRF